jgi:hypothetical protein
MKFMVIAHYAGLKLKMLRPHGFIIGHSLAKEAYQCEEGGTTHVAMAVPIAHLVD